MKPGPFLVAQIIQATLPIDAPPRSLQDVVSDIIAENPRWRFVPEEKAFFWAPIVEKILANQWSQMVGQGRQPNFSFNSISDYKLQGACFIEPCDSPEVKEQKWRRLRWRNYYERLRGLSPDVFEKVCTGVLGLLGVPKPVLTPYRGDQGIDFFGKMSLGDITGHGPLFPVFETDLVVWLIGQAKHYPDSKISTPDIRALAGSALLGRARAFPKEDALPLLNIRVCDPIIMLFLTTGQISSDGWELCRKSGVAAMDGEMLSAFLADKQVGIEGEGESRQFSDAAFATWVQSLGRV